MTWLRYSDHHTQGREWDGVSYEARWHYLALVELCSRGGRWDGRLPLEQARRASDVPDPDRCIAELEAIGRLTLTAPPAPVDNPAPGEAVTRNRDVTSAVTGDGVVVTVTRIDEHVPPPSIRDNAAKSKVRMRRKRAHDRGEHHLCLPGRCPDAPGADAAAPPGVTPRVTRNTGTGQIYNGGHHAEPAPDSGEETSSQSSRVGGAGGGVTRNTPPGAPSGAEPPPSALRDAQQVQDRKGIRALMGMRYPGVDEAKAARIVAAVRAESRQRGVPIHDMPRYLRRMETNGDLAAYVTTALGLDPLTPETEAGDAGASGPDRPLQVVEQDPRARRAAIDACDRCDANGLTRGDRPRRCDHKAPGQGSQMPLLQPMPDGAHCGQDVPARPLPAADARAEARAVFDRVNASRTRRTATR